ncbi:MAG: CRTAC1 family protein [Planctomycetota bacterium]|nr:CRTAC1 family protein [Planctomycetota bacterium]
MSVRKINRRVLLAVTLLIGNVSTARSIQGQQPYPVTIERLDPESHGIGFVHTDGGNGNHYILETVIGSLALFDFDGDGLIDIYFVNGAPLPGSDEKMMPTGKLYRNLGNFRFEDVTQRCGLADSHYGMGVVVADVDNDGDPDLFLSTFGENAFYLNSGDGTFQLATDRSGLLMGPRFGAGNVFFDFNLDGNVDLFAASYVEFAMSQHRVRHINGYPFSLGPNDFPPAKHYLFLSNGDSTFVDVSKSSGLDSLRSTGMGALSADFDDDGDMDLFVANDQKPNYLLLNDGKGHLEDDALLAGVARDQNGRANGNMGVEYADINNDGRLDFLTTTYQEEMPIFYENLGPGIYNDSTTKAKIDSKLLAHVKWGIGAVDFDNDGSKDVFVACGHFLPNIRFIDDRTSVKVPNFLLANNGKGVFRDVSQSSGTALLEIESSRGAAFDDLDNDGDVDLVVLNVNARPTLGRTELQTANRMICLQLVGTQSNRDAIGASVEVISSSGQIQKQVVMAGRGYESHYGTRLYFGIGDSQVSNVNIRWPSGKQERFVIGAERIEYLVEGSGTQDTKSKK